MGQLLGWDHREGAKDQNKPEESGSKSTFDLRNSFPLDNLSKLH